MESGMESNPGVYLLNNVIYSKYYEMSCVKIGSSIDVARRYKSGEYRTMILPEDQPTFIASIHPDGYSSIKEIQFLERATHHHFNKLRLNPKRELFNGVTLEHVANFYDILGVSYKINKELPKAVYTSDQLFIKEYDLSLIHI